MGQGNRIFAIDALRGIAISVVIFGHALQKVHGITPPHPVHAIILCCQMELFFAIAGYVARLSRGGGFWHDIGKKAHRLLVPYITWVTIAFAGAMLCGKAHWGLDAIWRYYFIHQFWFLRTLFYIYAIHAIARRVYEITAAKWGVVLRIIALTVTMFALLAIVHIVLGDAAVPKYLAWFYIGFGLRSVIKVESADKAYSTAGRFLAFLGQESLALYALHWWLFFKILPIPACPSILPEIIYVLVIFCVWLTASLAIDKLLSKTALAEFLLGMRNNGRIGR